MRGRDRGVRGTGRGGCPCGGGCGMVDTGLGGAFVQGRGCGVEGTGRGGCVCGHGRGLVGKGRTPCEGCRLGLRSQWS